MRAENSQYSFNINPAKSILILQLVLATLSLLLVAAMSILFWVQVFTVLFIVVLTLMSVMRFRAQDVDQLSYRAATKQWFRNGYIVRLRPDQFVTRNLLIIYFTNDKGKKITQLAPADSMSRQQHIKLRKLLIECMHTANHGEPPHPAQQN